MSDRRDFLMQAAVGVLAVTSPTRVSSADTKVSASAGSSTKTRKIAHTALSTSRLALGGVQLAGWRQGATVSTEEVAKAARLINTAYENGITLFDHADLYAFGNSERVFGEVLKQSPGLRSKIVVQTKCGQRFPDGWVRGQPIRVDLSRENILSAAEGSLQRLRTDYVDILLLHVPDALADIDEVARAFDELHRGGKVRYFGVSNYSAHQMQLLQGALPQPLVVNQLHIGLGHVDLLTDGMEMTLALTRGSSDSGKYSAVAGAGTVDYCRGHGVQVQAYSPLRGDLLKPGPQATPRTKQIAQRLSDLAAQKNTTAAVVALAWLMRHPAGIVPIFGASTPEHIAENCSALNVTLSRDEWYDLFATAADIEGRSSKEA